MLVAKNKFSSNHSHCDRHHPMKVTEEPVRPAYNNIFEAVGNTPLVKLNKIPRDHKINDKVEIYVKCEFMNPGGSIKDRIAREMVDDECENINNFLKGDPSRQVLEPTSGNTGIGIAANCAYRGFKCKILTSHKCSSEKVNAMRLLGAEIEYTRQGETVEKKSHELLATGNYFMLDQGSNRMNPQAHYNTTAEEIIRGLAKTKDGDHKKVNYLVCCGGSGGTLTGTAAKLKECDKTMKLIAADIEGSQLFHPGKRHPFQVEGIHSDAHPPLNLNMDLVDEVVVVSDQDSFLMAREMAKKEAILCGSTGGMAVKAALMYARKKDLKSGVIVVILPDGIQNSMTKFVSDPWMEAYLYKDPPVRKGVRWYNAKLKELEDRMPDNHIVSNMLTVSTKNKCREVLEQMVKGNVDVALVIDEHDVFVGLASLNSIRHEMTDTEEEKVGRTAQADDFITEYMDPDVQLLDRNYDKAIVGLVSRILDIRRYVVVGDAIYYPPDNNNPNDKVIKELDPKYVVSAEDLACFIQNYEHGPHSRFENRRQLPPCSCK